uniref:Catenin alpha 2 n=1 Tax=Pseudonaja textilis TaxID=8673 RepID=A0A670Z271_PSETE
KGLSMTSATSPIILKWDPKSLEIRTLTVERLLEPLVTQVSHRIQPRLSWPWLILVLTQP